LACFGQTRRLALWEAGAAAQERDGRLPSTALGVGASTLPGMEAIDDLVADVWARSEPARGQRVNRAAAPQVELFSHPPHAEAFEQRPLLVGRGDGVDWRATPFSSNTAGSSPTTGTNPQATASGSHDVPRHPVDRAEYQPLQ
jgi:hypothetical protein